MEPWMNQGIIISILKPFMLETCYELVIHYRYRNSWFIVSYMTPGLIFIIHIIIYLISPYYKLWFRDELLFVFAPAYRSFVKRSKQPHVEGTTVYWESQDPKVLVDLGICPTENYLVINHRESWRPKNELATHFSGLSCGSVFNVDTQAAQAYLEFQLIVVWWRGVQSWA